MKLAVEYVDIDSIKPYDRNAKLHPDQQIEQIKQSITEFGFNDPIATWNGEVVEGHGRLEAAKQLGITEVPVIRLDDLTDEQRKAYGLVHNKLTMNSDFDLDMLSLELDDIELDMSVFGFEMPEEDEGGYYGDERERTYNSVNLNEYNADRTVGYYQMPIIEPCNFVPEKLIGFNYVKTAKETDCGVHFFLDDYQFERIWNQPNEVIQRLERFECVLTPDFSLYMDMPRAMKIWNVYRSRLIGQIMQDYGYKVIPTVSWAEDETFDFCFDGLPTRGSIAVSTVGVMRDAQARELWVRGMDEAMKRLKPKNVLCYGSRIEYDFGKAKVKYYDARGFAE